MERKCFWQRYIASNYPERKKNFEIEMRASVGRQIIICLMQDIQVVFLAFEVFD